ncbi:putative bifunctional diguanylate cyclase/phosphodiesterase [Sphingomonas sp. BAUL-RG-20F-R05-02]|uniref:putative bifunctional diguanylate cyclase/phosphodiesterase n=1 Tax=Sphingomonas sp. BAUL-RG-20F-R05-02 TaxID=2914830 RepID=UPI001F580155|nr:EAL domain-containing protein [Sphingomonas sp. BAUL-RG-20F-R05-02]
MNFLSLKSYGRRKSNWLILGISLLIGAWLAAMPIGAAIDRGLSPARFGVVHRAASGKLLVVEMDAKSAMAIKRWPWSRSNYAKVVDHLRQAGAASILFDVEFSSPSDAAGDEAFAAALARADGIVALPTFGQNASSRDQRTIDALPIGLFRPHVALASVSIRPDADGQVRSMPFGTSTAGTARPSLSAYIAQRSGTIDTGFPIDMSIDPETIPRLSFIDIRDGKFDSAQVRGRSILIGATAIEMGDRYGTPLWGVIPGVSVQALAAETLLRGVPQSGGATMPVLLAMAAALLIVHVRGIGIAIAMVGSQLVLCVAILLAQHALLIVYPLAAGLGIILFAGLTCGARDVADRFRLQRMKDEDTGLPNSRALISERQAGTACTLIVTQFNNYDSLLAVLGTSGGADVVLRIADRLRLIAKDASVYRLADRHLAVLLPLDHPVDDTLDGLRSILLQPVEVAGRRVDVAVSLGLASGSVGDIERLMADATLAADDASQAGVFWLRGVVDKSDLERSISLMGELDAAIAADLINVYYQPKYNLREGRITSAEALVRWHHPERGFVGPDVFIPFAEKANRIAPLTLYVLRRVIKDVLEWRAEHGSITAAVNISANLLSDAAFNAQVEDILLGSALPSTALVFEVTESAAMSDPKSAVAALNRYRDLGVAVSMDDYGTGQSTLTYLKDLPLNELKIDRSFVQHAHRNRDDGVLVTSTIRLAHELGLKVVAEGVEDHECLHFLQTSGCDFVQGYFISRPLPLAQFLNFLKLEHKTAA